MIVFRPTRRLAERLGLDLPDDLRPVGAPYVDWCLHAFTAARRRHLIVANTSSLFSIITRDNDRWDARRLVEHALAAVNDQLTASGYAFFLERFIAPESTECTFCPIGSRSVLGSINQLVLQARWFLEKSDLSPAETSERINMCPLTILRGGTPAVAFPALVGVRE